MKAVQVWYSFIALCPCICITQVTFAFAALDKPSTRCIGVRTTGDATISRPASVGSRPYLVSVCGERGDVTVQHHGAVCVEFLLGFIIGFVSANSNADPIMVMCLLLQIRFCVKYLLQGMESDEVSS